MNFKGWITSFLIGGTVTTLIVGLEESNFKTLSGIAALMPVFTMVSYFLLGTSQDSSEISNHSKFVLYGTLVAWVPYMIVIATLAPKLGTNRSIGLGLLVFFALAAAFVLVVQRYGLFK
jgi:uncharacterized membrane protein (GlpM family)